jgi:hypothetical protein
MSWSKIDTSLRTTFAKITHRSNTRTRASHKSSQSVRTKGFATLGNMPVTYAIVMSGHEFSGSGWVLVRIDRIRGMSLLKSGGIKLKR